MTRFARLLFPLLALGLMTACEDDDPAPAAGCPESHQAVNLVYDNVYLDSLNTFLVPAPLAGAPDSVLEIRSAETFQALADSLNAGGPQLRVPNFERFVLLGLPYTRPASQTRASVHACRADDLRNIRYRAVYTRLAAPQERSYRTANWGLVPRFPADFSIDGRLIVLEGE